MKWLILCLSLAAFGAESPFPACHNPKLPPDNGGEASCRPGHTAIGSLRAAGNLSSVSAIEAFKTKLRDQLHRSQQARKILLDCMDRPNTDCQNKLARLKTRLTENLSILRLSIAMSNAPRDSRDHSIVRQIRWPGFAGGQPLASLSEQEHTLARSVQNQMLKDADQFVGRKDSISKLRLATAEVRKICADRDADYDLMCQRYAYYLQRQFVFQREDMMKLSEQLISNFPFVVNFDQLPISDEALRSALTKSSAEIQKFERALDGTNGLAEDLALHSFRGLMNSVLEENPAACGAIQAKVEESSRQETHKRWTTRALKGVLIGGICVMSGGTGCLGAMVADTALKAGTETQSVREQMKQRSAMDDLEQNSPYQRLNAAGVERLQERYNDMIASLALGGEEGGDPVTASHRPAELAPDDANLSLAALKRALGL